MIIARLNIVHDVIDLVPPETHWKTANVMSWIGFREVGHF